MTTKLDFSLKELRHLLESGKSSAYVFRTRLERAIERVQHIGTVESNSVILEECKIIKQKLNYISDQSNQTSDGTLRSFTYLYTDIKSLFDLLQSASRITISA